MKEISLKIPARKSEAMVAPEMSKDRYPSFNIYDKAPEELMKCDIGYETTAKVRLSSKELHEGDNTRKSLGFDVISVMVNSAKKLHKSGSKEYME